MWLPYCGSVDITTGLSLQLSCATLSIGEYFGVLRTKILTEVFTRGLLCHIREIFEIQDPPQEDYKKSHTVENQRGWRRKCRKKYQGTL